MSGRVDREAREEESPHGERQAADERRQRLIKLGSAAAFIAVVAVAVLIVVSSGSSGGDPNNVGDAGQVEQLLDGIPQHGLILGDLGALVTLIEFGDLQCPACKAYSEQILPQVIENKVRSGQAKLVFSNFTIIGPESVPAGAAAIAAGEQRRGWNFVELFYRNQGAENSGYVTDRFLTSIAKHAGVRDIAQWNRDRKSKRVIAQVERTTDVAENYVGFSGTPSFATLGLVGNNEYTALESTGSAGALETAIEEEEEEAD